MSVTGRCTVCAVNLRSDNTYALKQCGHTFHKECVSRWLVESNTCPHCRKRTHNKERDVIRIYFEEPENLLTQTLPVEEQFVRLQRELEIERTDHETTKDEKNKLVKEKTDLDRKLKEEKKKTVLLKSAQERNRHLEGLLQEQQQLQERARLAEERLKACDFYVLLKTQTLSDRTVEEKIDMYIKNTGGIDDRNFLKLLRNQLNDLEKKYNDVVKSTHRFESENRELRMKGVQYKKEIERLKKVLAQARGIGRDGPTSDAAVDDSFRSPPRKSFGFNLNETEIHFGDLLHSITRDKRQPALRFDQAHPSTSHEGKKTSPSIIPFSFIDSPEKENHSEVNSKKRRVNENEVHPTYVAPGVYQQPSTSARHTSLIDDVQVPTPVMKRAISMPKKLSSTSLSSAPVNYSANPLLSAQKPSMPLKRTLSGNSTSNKASKKLPKKPAKDQPRLSLFFAREKSSSSRSSTEIIDLTGQ